MAELGLDPAELDRRARAAHRAVRRRRARTPHACGRGLRAAPHGRYSAEQADRQPLGVGHGADRPRRGQSRASRSACSTATSPSRSRPTGSQRCGRRASSSAGWASTTRRPPAARCRPCPACSRSGATSGSSGSTRSTTSSGSTTSTARRSSSSVTHCGLDVGEDGKTHQCLDYVGAFRELLRLEGDRARRPEPDRPRGARGRRHAGQRLHRGGPKQAAGARWAPTGRRSSRGDYEFAYGEIVWAREGSDAVVLTMGTLAGAAVEAADALLQRGHLGRGGDRRLPAAPGRRGDEPTPPRRR